VPFLQNFEVEKNKKYALVLKWSSRCFRSCCIVWRMHRDPQLGTKHSLNISVSAGCCLIYFKINWEVFVKKSNTFSAWVILLFQNNFSVINFITNTNYASISSRPIKEHNRSSNSNKNKLCRSFVNSAPEITAIGNQIYCPGSAIKIVTDVTITHDP
jgi:hypothetical protein